jgi:hypothetical protein
LRLSPVSERFSDHARTVQRDARLPHAQRERDRERRLGASGDSLLARPCLATMHAGRIRALPSEPIASINASLSLRSPSAYTADTKESLPAVLRPCTSSDKRYWEWFHLIKGPHEHCFIFDCSNHLQITKARYSASPTEHLMALQSADMWPYHLELQKARLL